MKFFGWTILKDDELKNRQIQTLPRDQNFDGALELTSSLSGWVGHGINFNEMPTEDEVKLVSKYREIAILPEIERAVDDIINETFSYSEEDYPVSVNLDHIETSILAEKTKETIREEFNNILDMLNFKNDCYSIFRHWYVDGRLYYQKIIDEKKPQDGILEIQYIDPRKIKKVRQQLEKKRDGKSPTRLIDGIDINQDYVEYYLYNPMGIQYENPTGLRITLDAIVFVHSGVHDRTNKVILSHLHKAIRPLNQLNMIENSLVIYRLARAPERRVFNVEVGNMPRQKVEEYMHSLKTMHRRKMMYDATTGDVLDDKRYMTMMEDFWFPKRDGKGTTVENLQAGQNLGQLEDVTYFKDKLIESLNVPHSRFEAGGPFNLGRSSEVTRDELKFMKFVVRLRKRFNGLFEDLLGSHLMLKKILTPKEWDDIKGLIKYDYLEDNQFTEFKWTDIWNLRMQTLQQSETAVQSGYISKNWVRTKILKIKDDEWDEIQKDIKAEKEEEKENNPNPFGGDNSDPNNPFAPKDPNALPPKEQIDGNTKDDNDQDQSAKKPAPPFVKKQKPPFINKQNKSKENNG